MRFEELDCEDAFDGVWACAFSLHLRKAELPSVLRLLSRALKADGVFYASDLDEAAQASALLAAGKPLEFRKQCAKCEVCFKAVKLREGKALPRRLAACPLSSPA